MEMAARPHDDGGQHKAWTVMLYMAAATDDRTESAARRDLEELQRVDTRDAAVNVVVQIDRQWPGYPERYRIVKGGSEPLSDDASLSSQTRLMSTGKPEPLQAFLRWVPQVAPAKRYLLVLWGHHFGIGFGRDHGEPLTIPELANALTTCAPNGKIDLLGANACAMSYAEAAYELRDAARYLVAPEITMPFQGWPYTEVLREIVKNPEIDARELGQAIVRLFMTSFGRKNVALTMLDLGAAGTLKEPLGALSKALDEVAQGDDDNATNPIRDAFLDTAHGDVRPLIDLDDLCANLAKVSDRAVSEQAALMRQQLQQVKLVVEHEADPDLEGLHGLGIYAPAVTGAGDLERLELREDDYKELALSKDTAHVWQQFVYHTLGGLLKPLNDTVAGLLPATGATSTGDRTGVSQLLLSINRAFDKLEGTVNGVKGKVMGVLDGSTWDPSAEAKTDPLADDKMSAIAAGDQSANHDFLRLIDYPPHQNHATPVSGVRSTSGNGHDAAHRRDAVAKEFGKLEEALGKAERTTRRVLTNANLGLGEPPVKAGLGVPRKTVPELGVFFAQSDAGTKAGLGEPPVKAGLGEPPVKAGMGLLSLAMNVQGDGAANDAAVLGDLYGQVARSLRDLEEALAKAENVALTNGTFDVQTAGLEHRRAVDQVQRSFKELDAALTAVKVTTWSVLTHPTYGLGPATPLSGAPDRSQIATASGLGPSGLRLL